MFLTVGLVAVISLGIKPYYQNQFLGIVGARVVDSFLDMEDGLEINSNFPCVGG